MTDYEELRDEMQYYENEHYNELRKLEEEENASPTLKADRDAWKARAEIAEAELKEAINDLKIMALAMRESDELSEGCCFACICENLPDNCILPYGECPGYEKTDCFEWRGAREGTK